MDDLTYLQNSLTTVNQNKMPIDQERAPEIVLVEDDEILGLGIKKYLEKSLGINVHYFTNGTELFEKFELNTKRPFCLITDISFENGPDGLLLIDILKEKGHDFASLVMTGFASIESAIQATKKEAYHYLTKPFELPNLLKLIKDCCQDRLNYSFTDELHRSEATTEASSNLHKSVTILKNGRYRLEQYRPEDLFQGILGRSPLMKSVFERIEKVANSDSTVLITGPSGTGKELVANAIHALSNRNGENKVSVNCGAIPSELLESELFGHVKGAFTGAISGRKGRFEMANKGSIFLDEIGDMPAQLQVKLLRVLQSRQIEPVGSDKTFDIDVRIIAATHRDLDRLVSEGKFREDLFYRLNVIPIKMPALKERREDIPLLISYFLERFVSADKRNQIEFTDETLALLVQHDWPGNVRELENVIERLVILRGGNKIYPEDLPARIYHANPLATSMYKHIFELPEQGVDLRQILSDIEDSLIEQALGRTKGNKNQASKLLGINRTTLIEKMKKKGLGNFAEEELVNPVTITVHLEQTHQ